MSEQTSQDSKDWYSALECIEALEFLKNNCEMSVDNFIIDSIIFRLKEKK